MGYRRSLPCSSPLSQKAGFVLCDAEYDGIYSEIRLFRGENTNHYYDETEDKF